MLFDEHILVAISSIKLCIKFLRILDTFFDWAKIDVQMRIFSAERLVDIFWNSGLIETAHKIIVSPA